MILRCNHKHESHIQGHELRVSGELEFGTAELDSPMRTNTAIKTRGLHDLFSFWHLPCNSDFNGF